METKKIAGRAIHPIGIGTWSMGGDRLSDGNPYADYRDDDACVEAIRYSIESGQNHIDTAQLYGAGHTEEIVGEALRGVGGAGSEYRDRFFVATKVWRSHSLRNAVPKAAEDSLRKMGIDEIDLLYVHAPWDAIEMREYIDGLNDAADAGLTKAIAVSNFSLDQLKAAVELSRRPIAANQVLYNVLDRGPVNAAFLDYCRGHDIAVVAYRPVERRLLADKLESDTVRRIADTHGRPPSQIAIRWLIQQAGVVTIPKAVSREHIDENLGALKFVLTDEEMAALDAARA